MSAGIRVIYRPPAGDRRSARSGIITAISGQSAFIQFDDCDWVQAAPLERLWPVKEN